MIFLLDAFKFGPDPNAVPACAKATACSLSISKFYPHTSDLNLAGTFTLQAVGNDCSVATGQTVLTVPTVMTYPVKNGGTGLFDFTITLSPSETTGSRKFCWLKSSSSSYVTIGTISVADNFAVSGTGNLF